MKEFAGSTVIPSVRYRDAHAAIAWLVAALGFEAKVVYDGPENTVAHAEPTFGARGMVMVGSVTNESPYAERLAAPGEIGGRVTSPLYLLVEDCEAVWARAQATGAEVVQALRSMEYGGKAFTVRDPEGYLWSVGEYDPWG